MKVYLAARFSQKNEIAKLAEELRAAGVEVTSRWLNEKAPANSTMDQYSDEYLRETAAIDLEDIDAADALVLFTVNPKEPTVRGGRHTEFGYAMGRGLGLMIVGPRENIFHYLPAVVQRDTWEEAKDVLLTAKQLQEEAISFGEKENEENVGAVVGEAAA